MFSIALQYTKYCNRLSKDTQRIFRSKDILLVNKECLLFICRTFSKNKLHLPPLEKSLAVHPNKKMNKLTTQAS